MKRENMENKIDKSEWPRGEWDNEPDYLEFVDADTGYKCEIRRDPHIGHLCGYVYIPKDSSLSGKHYNDLTALAHKKPFSCTRHDDMYTKRQTLYMRKKIIRNNFTICPKT